MVEIIRFSVRIVSEKIGSHEGEQTLVDITRKVRVTHEKDITETCRCGAEKKVPCFSVVALEPYGGITESWSGESREEALTGFVAMWIQRELL